MAKLHFVTSHMHCFTYILVGYSSGGSEGVVVGVVGVVVIGEVSGG